MFNEWTKLRKEVNKKISEEEEVKMELSFKLIVRYIEFLMEKRMVVMNYKDYIEGSYAPVIKLKDITESYMLNPLVLGFIKSLLHLLQLLIKLHSVLFEMPKYLWNIRLGIALCVMREEYALISLFAHILKFYQISSPSQRDLNIDIKSLFKDFAVQYFRAVNFFNTLQLIPEFKERDETLFTLPWGLIDYLRTLKPDHEQEEILTLFQSIDDILDITIPQSVKHNIDGIEDSKSILKYMATVSKVERTPVRNRPRLNSIAFKEVANQFGFPCENIVHPVTQQQNEEEKLKTGNEENKFLYLPRTNNSLQKLITDELNKLDPAFVINMNEVSGITKLKEENSILKGVYRGTEVVIRTYINLNEEQINELRKELAILSLIRHPNITLFIGGGITPKKALCLITEFCNGGTVSQLLHDLSIPLNWKQKGKICLDTAKGMNSLHSYKIVFESLRSNKIFLVKQVKEESDPIIVKIGLISDKNNDIQFTAPEILQGEPYTAKSDVYSFGVLVWEVVTRSIPYKGMNHEEIINHVMKGGGRPDEKLIPEECPVLVLL